MDISLHREHAARCRAMAEGSDPVLRATLLQLAVDLDSQAAGYEEERDRSLLRRA